MNFRLLVLVTLISLKVSSQEKLNYSFDTFTSFIKTSYEKSNQRNNYVVVRNLMNKNYYLSINNNLMSATLFDINVNKVFHFKLKNRIEKILDLKQLDSAIYNSNTNLKIIKNDLYKNVVEEIEFERDTVQKKFIVHKINFKNNKKKKILNEHYYIFKENKNTANFEKSNIIKILSDKFSIPFTEFDDIEKIIDVEDGKKISETEYISTKTEYIKINFIAKEE